MFKTAISQKRFEQSIPRCCLKTSWKRKCTLINSPNIKYKQKTREAHEARPKNKTSDIMSLPELSERMSK